MKGRPDLGVTMCGVRFANPFILSSSPVSNSAEMVEKAYEHGWAGVCYKTLNSGRIPITHPSPRMAGYDYEAKRLVGLQNVEQISDRPLKDNLADFLYLKKRWPDRPIIASIMGFSNDEWAFLAKAAADNGADMLELNFSCPHMTVEGSGHKVGQAFALCEKFTATVKRAVRIPVLAKMTPNITDMTEPAIFSKKGGADGISAVNTFRGHLVDRPGRPRAPAQRVRRGRDERLLGRGDQAHRAALHRGDGPVPRAGAAPVRHGRGGDLGRRAWSTCWWAPRRSR